MIHLKTGVLYCACLSLILGCGQTSQGTYFPHLDIKLDSEGPLSIAGVDIWMLDLSPFVQGAPSKNGAFICQLNENGACWRELQYRYCSMRQPWQLPLLIPALLTERFVFVAVRNETPEILGKIAIPELTDKQFYGSASVPVRGGIEVLSARRSSKLTKRLQSLDSFKERAAKKTAGSAPVPLE